MKTPMSHPLFFLCLIWLYGAPTHEVKAQPLVPVEVAACQDFFGSIREGKIELIEDCLSQRPEFISRPDENRKTPLLVATQHGQTEVVKLLLSKGASWSELTPNGLNALHVACNFGQTGAATLLVDAGAPLNEPTSRGTYPIHYAANSGNLELVQWLEINGADLHAPGGNQSNLLHWAAMGGSVDVYNYVASKNFDTQATDGDGDGMLHWAATGRSATMVDYLINERGFSIHTLNQAKEIPLELAIRFRQFETAKYLFENEKEWASDNHKGQSWLHLAAHSGFYPFASYLIEKGFAVDLLDTNQMTPLCYAASTQNLQLVKLLVEQGAVVNQPSESMCQNEVTTPLHRAAWNNPAIVKYLIEKGANMNARNSEGQTPLHIAVLGRDLDCAKILIEAGADINARDTLGRTPLHLAIGHKKQDISNWLLTQAVDVTLTDHLGKTVLHEAAIAGMEQLIVPLLSKNAPTTSCDRAGNSPLFYANYYSNTKTAQALLKCGAKEELFSDADYCHKPLKKGEAMVWYLNHSGFAVKTAQNLLIFDYWQPDSCPDNPCINNGFVCPQQMKDEKVTVFVSHTHTDHYSRGIFNWNYQIKNIRYVLGFQETNAPVAYQYVAPQTTKKIDGLKITAIESTDSGEGFLVEVDGVTIYHSGDHANGLRENPTDFTEEIDFLAKQTRKVDLAFFPVTGCRFRDKEALIHGTYYALDKLKPRISFPMHASGNEDALYQFVVRADQENENANFQVLTHKGDRFYYSRTEMSWFEK